MFGAEERRFGGIARLYGADGAHRLAQAHVAIVGIGGVGSWSAEALARSGVGSLTLIDLDIVAESNVNRHIHAQDSNFGKAKVAAMAERIREYSPTCQVHTVDDFLSPDNAKTLLDQSFDALIDATDQVKAKCAMIGYCSRHRPLYMVTVGAAGGQVDPTRVRADDLARTIQDPLLARVRAELRKQHGFPRQPGKRFGIVAIYSDEPLRYPPASCSAPSGSAGLNCSGFGSSVCVTATFGLAAAAQVINHLTRP